MPRPTPQDRVTVHHAVNDYGDEEARPWLAGDDRPWLVVVTYAGDDYGDVVSAHKTQDAAKRRAAKARRALRQDRAHQEAGIILY